MKRAPRAALRAAFAALALLLSACSSAAIADGHGGITVFARDVRLDPSDPKVDRVGKLRFLGGVSLSSTDDRFGGWSGLRVDPAGQELRAISDEGYWLAARISYRDGRLAGLTNARLGVLRDLDGTPLHGKGMRDAEGLTLDATGHLVVSFERNDRIWRYGPWPDGLEAKPNVVPTPEAIERQPYNGGIEAITAIADGRLLAISEELMLDPETHAGWLIGPKGAQSIGFARTGEFKATDLALLPDGDVLVLERRFTPMGGPGMRLSRVKAADVAAGKRLVGETLAELPARLTVDNMEGLAVRTEAGRTLLYVISDDNYNPLQRTLLMMFELEP
jgi:hypothetical protein